MDIFVICTGIFVSSSAACSNSCRLSCSNSASHWLIKSALASHWLKESHSIPSRLAESIRSKPETHIDKSTLSIWTNKMHMNTNCDTKQHACSSGTHTDKHAHLLDLLANFCHLWYVAELPHKLFHSGLVVPHPFILHTELIRVHQLVPVPDHLESHLKRSEGKTNISTSSDDAITLWTNLTNTNLFVL